MILSSAEKSEDRVQSNMERTGPVEKVYEAYSAIADDRGSISNSEHLAMAESSDNI